MNELPRLFTALILSMGAIFLWNLYYVDPKVKEKAAQQQVAQQNNVIPSEAEGSRSLHSANAPVGMTGSSTDTAPVTAAANPVANLDAQMKAFDSIKPRDEIVAEGFAANQRVRISTDRVHGSINLNGGMIDDITLAKYHETLDKSSPEVVLLSPRRTEKLYFLNAGWLSKDSLVPDDNTLWKLDSGSVLTPTSPVTLRFSEGGLVYYKTFTIDDKYMITMKQTVQNSTPATVLMSPYALINRTYDLKQKVQYVSHEGVVAVVDGKLNEEDYKDLAKEDGAKSYSQSSGWIGIGDKYWLSAIIPQNSAEEKFDIAFKHYQKDNIDRFQADILGKTIQVAPGASADYSYNIYAGAKKLSLLEEHQKSLNITLFDRAIDFGSLYFLTKPIFKTLTFFHKEIGNMGLSIMLLTVCIRLILFPLANMSFKSMARMKKHMPEINKLKERNKGDRQKQGQEMMKYYREHKINPAAGCLPVLLQIPVFFALYKALYVTIEMRHEPFLWFIHDLSVQDPTNILTLFGFLMWDVPSWLPHIGILPILFSFSMMVQQQLNPPMADETQRIVMAWMPWIFLFVFSNFAAGLVIYWIWNNTLSILQQSIITRKIEQDKNE